MDVTISNIKAKKGQDPIVCLTAYTGFMAKLIKDHVDLILVGDSLGMVLYDLPTTVPVSLEMMKHHGAAVARAAPDSLVIVDLPFGSYQQSPEQAYKNCVDLMQQTYCAGVKLEGGSEMKETISFLAQRGVPVMGHIGLKPQSVHVHGGYKMTGHDASEKRRIIQDAQDIEEAGAFAVVLECVHSDVAEEVTKILDIPTIGIGSSNVCDGQILVTEDLLGLTGEPVPSFVKQYKSLHKDISEAVENYGEDVKTRKFPHK